MVSPSGEPEPVLSPAPRVVVEVGVLGFELHDGPTLDGTPLGVVLSASTLDVGLLNELAVVLGGNAEMDWSDAAR
jgi:hypothetical protein